MADGGGWGPLGGLRVLELGSDSSVAFGSRLLADMGAEVIKIEPPRTGDAARHEPPYIPDAADGDSSARFAYLNYGKRSVSLNIRTPSGMRLLRELSAQCQLLVSDGASLSAAGLEPANENRAWPERPTTIATSAFGLAGPDATRPSSPFTLQHSSGFAFHQASPVTHPEKTPPVALADWEGSLAPGLVVAIAALWALRGADRARPGPVIDLSLQDVLTYILVEPFSDWQMGMNVADRRRDPAKGLTIAGGLVWLLPCRDGTIMVSPREDHQWKRWLEVMDHPDWANDPTLCGDRTVRTGNAARLQEKMAAWSIGEATRDVVARAQAARVACFPVSSPSDLLANEQLRERSFFSSLPRPTSEPLKVAGLPFRFVSSDGQELARGGDVRAPKLGGDNDGVLASWLGLVASDIEQLRARAVI